MRFYEDQSLLVLRTLFTLNSEFKYLYWIDIDGHKINCYDPSSCNNETRKLPFKAGSLAIRKQGGLLLAMSNGFYNYDFKKQESYLNEDSYKYVIN